MTSQTKRRIFAGVSAVFLAYGTWATLTAPTFQACVSHEARSRAEERNEPAASRTVTIGDRAASRGICTWHTFADQSVALTAIAIFLTAAFTYKLWMGGEATLAHLQASSQRESRAYVHVSNVDITRITDDTGPAGRIEFKHRYRAKVLIENVGKTPAHAVTHHAAMAWIEGPQTAPPDIELSKQAPRDVLGPDVQADITWESERLTPAQWEAIGKETASLYIYGRVDYRNVFGVWCWTTYRWRIIPSTFGNDHPDTVACAEGNSADDEFKDP